MPFSDENLKNNLKLNDPFQIGISNVDPGKLIETGIVLPWPSSPEASYLYYDCIIEVFLDSGIVIHNRLPQVDNTPDSLATTYLDATDLNDIINRDINLKSNDSFTDIQQRMGHSRYWFNIKGQALRVGYKIPIPAIKTIGGVPAVPHDTNPQRAFNSICPGCNFGGVVLWRAQWSLWYTTLVPPTAQTIPAADPTTLTRGVPVVPDNIQSPYTTPDDNAVKTAPSQTNGLNNPVVLPGSKPGLTNPVTVGSKPVK